VAATCIEQTAERNRQKSAWSRQLSGWLRRVFLLVIKETALTAHRVSRVKRAYCVLCYESCASSRHQRAQLQASTVGIQHQVPFVRIFGSHDFRARKSDFRGPQDFWTCLAGAFCLLVLERTPRTSRLCRSRPESGLKKTFDVVLCLSSMVGSRSR
jgi:hypothetical protein